MAETESAITTAAENETNDAALPEDLKKSSFDKDGNEIPFDEILQARSTAEETWEESPPTTPPSKPEEEEDAVENDNAETMTQKEEQEAEPEALEEEDAGDNAENTAAEASGEETETPNHEAESAPEEENVPQNESPPGPEPDTKDTKPLSVKIPSDDDPSGGNKAKETPSSARSGGMSFAQAFSPRPITPTMKPVLALKSPGSTTSKASSTRSNQDNSANDTPTSSHSAVSASKNKRASGLISKYQEKVAHETLPGDLVPLRSSSFDMSPGGTQQVVRQISPQAYVELNSLPDMNSVRAKFEKSSRKSGSSFEFGESFRKMKRNEQLTGKQKEKEAKVAIRGFDEKLGAEGVIDMSNLPKSFSFDTANASPLFPTDGICRVDYANANFRAKVFVVHKTRGMLLLQHKHGTVDASKSSGKKGRMNTVPGGEINEDEFLAAAKENGSPQVQLQIAAREAAARHVFESTGLDIRMQADRLKPAVMCMTPTMNAARGYEFLRNEKEEKLYYFLQVEEEDFEKLKEAQGDDAAPAKLKRPSQDPGDDPLTLKLSSDYGGYEFIQDPVKASKVLKKDGNDAAVALSMIMNAANQEITSSKDSAAREPDAKATEFSSKPDDEQDKENENGNDGTIRTVGIKEGEEGKSKPAKSDEGKSVLDELQIMKSPSEATVEPVGVSCCCGFW